MPTKRTEAIYDAYWSPQSHGWAPHPTLSPLLRNLLEQLISKESFVLDIGCGDGMHYGAEFARIAQAYYGVDASSVAVQAACRNGIQAQRHDLEETLPFSDAMFDCVVCIEVLEHLIDPAFVLGEIKRVLKPKGQVLLAVPNIAHIGNRIRMLLGGFAPGGTPETSSRRPWADPHIRFFTLRSFSGFATEQQMEIVRLDGEAFSIFTTLPVLSPLAERWLGWSRLEHWSKPFEFAARWYPSLCAGHLAMIARRAR
jgi:methionine biosynthesis protein MetW